MKSEFEIEKYNGEILRRIGAYLNYGERSIDAAQVKKVSGCGVGKAKAVELLLAGYIDADEILEKEYLPYMLKLLDIGDYKADRYKVSRYCLRTVAVKNAKLCSLRDFCARRF